MYDDVLLILFVETFFLINWLEEDDPNLYDIVPSKDVVPPEDVDVLDIKRDTVCRVSYSGMYYKAKIIQQGEIKIIAE